LSKPRTFVLGDIHGNYKAFDQCLERSYFDLDVDTLIQLGDVCDRHDQSAYVVDQLIQIPNLISIRGNHDLMLRSWLQNDEIPEGWEEQGGLPTIESYQRVSIDKTQHLAFLENQKNHHVDSQNRLFIHAGFIDPKGPEYDYPNNCYNDRTLWQEALDGRISGNQPERSQLFKEIFIGHTPTTNWNQITPMHAFNIWNMDTGAGLNGKLSMMDIDSKVVWQSDAFDD